jgi:endonuclease YncB( thermonuclease family)
MFPRFQILLCVALLTLCSNPSAAQVESGQTFTARVVEVTDGDTYDVNRSGGGEVTIRLFGVDAPESGQPYGSESTNAAREYAGGKNVRVEVEDTDRYGRAVARIEIQGGDLGAMLIRDGLAWHYEQYAPNETEYSRLERQARNASRGLWSRANPTPPWEWRSQSSGQPANDRNCSDFDTQREAQRFFERNQPGDPHNLDGNGDGEACESLPRGGGETSEVVNSLSQAAGVQDGEGLRASGLIGAGLHSVPSLTSGALYGLNGGLAFHWGRFRVPVGADVMFSSYTPEGYSYDDDVDRCRGPGGQFAEDEECTAFNTFVWLHTALTYDITTQDNDRLFVGVGVDAGAFTAVHGVLGLLTEQGIWGEVRIGGKQVGVSAGFNFSASQ